jgi:putative ABC transport system permease protein
MGLFGLSLFIINTRIKEIGIRKVNGSKMSEILMLLNASFLRWVFMAYIIAAPIAYLVITKWFENFAYRTDIHWGVFAMAGCITIIVALITVSFQSINAARRNPVEALRYE